METIREVTMPLTKPETEWIFGRPVQKSMPPTDESMLQKAFLAVLDRWVEAQRRGVVGAERRFRASPPGELMRPLVPDVAYRSLGRLRSVPKSDRQVPAIAPEIVVEILSPDDRDKDVVEKRRVYFAWGVLLEIVADPALRTVDFYDANGRYQRVDSTVEVFTPAAFPDLQLPIRTMFDKLDIFGDDDLTS